MTKQVIASIKGLQFTDDDEGEELETLTPAEYYFRNGSHYLLFEEIDEESGRTTKNVLKYRDHVLELTKKGMINVHMVFEEHKKNVTSYQTPFGDIMVGIDAAMVEFEETQEKLCIIVDYALDINYERLADCQIRIEICPQDHGEQLFS